MRWLLQVRMPNCIGLRLLNYDAQNNSCAQTALRRRRREKGTGVVYPFTSASPFTSAKRRKRFLTQKGREGRRRRLKGERGRGTLEKEKPPIFGMIQRSGEVVIRMLANVQQVTIEPIMRATIAIGTVVYTDECDIYARVTQWGSSDYSLDLPETPDEPIVNVVLRRRISKINCTQRKTSTALGLENSALTLWSRNVWSTNR